MFWPFRRAATQPPGPPTREIFRYFDGIRERGIDPLRALRELASNPAYDPEADPLLADQGDSEATSRTLAAIRDVFGVLPWQEVPTSTLAHTGGGHVHSKPATAEIGLTDGETFDLLDRFMAYMESIKKNTNAPPTWPPVTAPECSTGSTEPKPDRGSDSGDPTNESNASESDTSDTSDCTSTSTEPRRAAPV